MKGICQSSFLEAEKRLMSSPLSKRVLTLCQKARLRSDSLKESSLLVGENSAVFGKKDVSDSDEEEDTRSEQGATVFSSSWLPRGTSKSFSNGSSISYRRFVNNCSKKKNTKKKKQSSNRRKSLTRIIVEDLVLSSDDEEGSTSDPPSSVSKDENAKPVIAKEQNKKHKKINFFRRNAKMSNKKRRVKEEGIEDS